MSPFELPEPGRPVEHDGYTYWHGSGRLSVCNTAEPHRMTSVLLRHLPPDADIDAIIAEMGRKVLATQPMNEGNG